MTLASLLLIVLCGFVGLVLWHYLGYPAFLSVVPWERVSSSSQEFRSSTSESLPDVSIIIAAYNEEGVIEDRIRNCLSVDYPENKLQVIVGSDGSTDQTVECARAVDDPRVTVLDFEDNEGRASVHNRSVTHATGDVLAFTDAETGYREDCLKELVQPFRDANVGAACGRLEVDNLGEDSIGEGMGLYWRWEYRMRTLQSELGILTKMTGANMAMRKSLYRELPDAIDIDQAAGFISYINGMRCEYVPSSVAYERFPTSLSGELNTRKRLTTQALTSIAAHSAVLNPLQYPKQALNTVSYWVLRYLMPFLFASVLIVSVILSLLDPVFITLLVPQVMFAAFGAIGYLLEKYDRTIPPFSVIFSYCWANLGVVLGVLNFMSGNRVDTYEPQ